MSSTGTALQDFKLRALSGGIRGYLGALWDYAYNYDGLTQFAQLSQTITLSGDFEVELKAAISETVSSNQSFCGGSGGNSPAAGAFTIYQSSNLARQVSVQLPRSSSTASYISVIAPVSGINSIALKRAGSTVTLTAGSQSASQTDAALTTPFEVTQISRWGTQLLKGGVVYGLKIWTGGDRNTGALILDLPMTDVGQAVQLPKVPALGANLCTQSVIENPFSKGNTWTYLGNGRWQMIGDGSPDSLQFLHTGSQPSEGYVEFEIESISGNGITCTNNNGLTFSTVGVHRYYYPSLSAITTILFKRANGVVNCVIKNIKHYNAAGIPIATIQNHDSSRWVRV